MSLDLPLSFNHFGPQLVFLVLLCSIGIVTHAPILHLLQGLNGTVLQLIADLQTRTRTTVQEFVSGISFLGNT